MKTLIFLNEHQSFGYDQFEKNDKKNSSKMKDM